MPIEDIAAVNFDGLPKRHYGAILADPPWRFRVWSGSEVVQKRNSKSTYKPAEVHYPSLAIDEITALPVAELCADDCVLFLWVTWPILLESLEVVKAWGFTYKTCAFNWTKADGRQIEMFQDFIETYMGLGYWTRANTEPCLLATRGNPKRLNADVRQAIVASRREHSRKPDGVHASIERLVSGPYLELFARQKRVGWDCWGNETGKFMEVRQDALSS